MSGGEVLIGAAFAAIVVASCAVVAVRVVGRWGRGADTGAERALALAIVFAAAFFVVHLIPGMLTILHRETVALLALLLAGASLTLEQASAPSTNDQRPTTNDTERLISIAAGAAVALYILALTLEHATEGLLQPDVASFHLPNIARWIESASLWQIDDFISNRAPGNYPQTGDVFMLGAILPFHADVVVRFVSIPFLALTALAVFAGGRELGARPAPAALCAAAIVAMPCVGYLAVQGVADTEMLGLFAAGGFFLLRHARTRNGFDLALAGIGLGLCFGTRWYAVPAVAAVLLVWICASLAAGRRGGLVRDGGVLAALVAAFGGFWLLRNWTESGNPVFPVEVAPFGVEILAAPRDEYRELEGFSLVHYAFEPGVWRDFLWRPFLEFMSFVAVFLWAAIPAAAILARVRRSIEPGASGRVAALVAVAVAVTLVYVITPYTAVGPEGAPTDAWVNARYVVPALVASAPAIAWALSRSGAAGLWLEALLALAVLDAIRRALGLPDGDAGVAAFAVAAVAIGIVAALWRLRGRFSALGAGTRAAIAAGGAAVLAAGLVGFADRYFDDRYDGLGKPIATVDAAPAGTVVGLLGEGWGIQPLFGDELENDVSYIGPRVDGMLRAYPTGEALAAAVERGGYDLIYVQDIDSLDDSRPERQAEVLRDLGWQRIATGTNPSFGAAVTTQLYAPPS